MRCRRPLRSLPGMNRSFRRLTPKPPGFKPGPCGSWMAAGGAQTAPEVDFRIPFNKPCLVGSELTYVGQAVAGGHASGDGPFTRRAQAMLEKSFGAKRVLLTNSCTAALEMAALLCDLQPGDEVIVPSYTFVSTANAFVLRGANPVFVDVRPDTFNIDERLIEQAITPRTRAIFPIHYAGVACEMDAIMAIADRHGLLVVEDAAQGVHRPLQGSVAGHDRSPGLLQLSRNQEFFLRGGRRARHQRCGHGASRRNLARKGHQP